MKIKKGKIGAMYLLSALAVVGMLVGGCGSNHTKTATETSQGYPITWTVSIDGKEVPGAVSKAPKRAVTMSQAATEMLLTLGVEKQMVGTSFLEAPIYEPLAEAYKKVPVIAEKWPSYEQFMAVQPDFTIGWAVDFTKKGIPAEKITSQHIPIYVPKSMSDENADLNTLFDDMIELGAIFDHKEKAEEWVTSQRNSLSRIQDKIKNLPKKRVFVYDNDSGQPFTVFSGYTDNILKLIGAENVMSGKSPGKTWAVTSWEQVVATNPDYFIILDYEATSLNDDTFEMRVKKLKENPQLQNVTAIKKNQFIRIQLSEITPGVRTVGALEALAKQLHGIQ